MASSYLLFALLCIYSIFFLPVDGLGELNGLQLRCCTLFEIPYVTRDYTNPTFSNFSGLAITYLDLLQKRLNFTCSSLVEFKAQKKEDQGFSGFTKEMARCAVEGDSSNCNCDLGVGSWAMASFRFPRVDFVAPYSTDSYGMITRSKLIKDSAPKSVIFRDAFSGPVWGGIASLVVLITILTLFDRNFAPATRLQQPALEECTTLQRLQYVLLKSKILYRIRKAIFNTFMNMVAQSPEDGSADGKKQGTKQRLISITSILVGFFLITVFQASVTVQVLVTAPVSDFETIEDVKSCRITADRICIPKGGSAEQYWKQTIESATASLPCASKSPQYVSSFEDGYKNVADGKCDWFYAFASSVMEAANGRYCKILSPVGSPFFDTTISYILPKSSNLTEVFSMETLKLREEGKLETARNLANKRKCPSVTDPTMTWDKLRIFFYVAYATIGFMFMIVVLDPGKALKDEEGSSEEVEEKEHC